MSIFASFDYDYNQELKHDRVRVDFHTAPAQNAIAINILHPSHNSAGVILALNEAGEYDAELMTLDY